ncbi:hypothetical protein LOD99_14261 [Oopsacas minuta]|uniref:N-acylethanolamine-hydrolyzing acid amidase n=1 Tax=Oopsacas minuta TaxID=111878 RepID=A0AAV7KJ03_9METZ|nr:hypothetical protein LOD99_14261 [Oopsacas minuta]
MSKLSVSVIFCLLYINFCGYNVLSIGTPRYSINLDLNPPERWKKVGQDYANILKNFKQDILEHYHIPKELVNIADKIGSDLDKYIPTPFSGEMIGLADTSNIPLSEIVLANLLYELTAFCTSIVAQNNTGQIIHGRNLDYNLMKELKPLVIDVDFMRGGKIVYTGTTFAGYVGLLTAQKADVLTITLNQRNEGNILENLLDLLLTNHSMVSFTVRDTLDNPNVTFQSAVNYLAYGVYLVTPAYLIVGGVNTLEGVVITRGRISAISIRQLDLVKGLWYVLETNYDYWTSPPPSDDRRDPAIQMLDKLGRDIALDTLYSVLNRKPVCNSQTTYTTVMSAADGAAYTTHIRDNDCS